MNKIEAGTLLETIIDTLIEVGNSVTEADIHKSAHNLIKFRDEWFNYALDIKDEIIRFEANKKVLASPYDLNSLAKERICKNKK